MSIGVIECLMRYSILCIRKQPIQIFSIFASSNKQCIPNMLLMSLLTMLFYSGLISTKLQIEMLK
jgi:hypothetical protein